MINYFDIVKPIVLFVIVVFNEIVSSMEIDHSLISFYSETPQRPWTPENEIEQLEHFRERCSDFRVINNGIPFENPRENTREYFFQTLDEGNLRLKFVHLPASRFDYVNGNMRQMEVMERELANSQNFSIPDSTKIAEGRHGRVIHFLAANMDVVENLLIKKKNHEQPKRKSKLFVEPLVPDPQINKTICPDLLYIGSDNRFRIFEIGNSTHKPKKARRYAAGLQMMYKNLTQTHLPEDRVIPYVVHYERERKESKHRNDSLTTLTIFETTIHAPLEKQRQDNFYKDSLNAAAD